MNSLITQHLCAHSIITVHFEHCIMYRLQFFLKQTNSLTLPFDVTQALSFQLTTEAATNCVQGRDRSDSRRYNGRRTVATDGETTPQTRQVKVCTVTTAKSFNCILKERETRRGGITMNSHCSYCFQIMCNSQLNPNIWLSKVTPSNGPFQPIDFAKTSKLSLTISIVYEKNPYEQERGGLSDLSYVI